MGKSLSAIGMVDAAIYLDALQKGTGGTTAVVLTPQRFPYETQLRVSVSLVLPTMERDGRPVVLMAAGRFPCSDFVELGALIMSLSHQLDREYMALHKQLVLPEA